MSASTPPTVFISYSHHDASWKKRLADQLKVLEHEAQLEVWEDRQIAAGSDWQAAIEQALARASVAILLVSAKSLTSKFILGQEIPQMLQRRSRDGLRLIPLIIQPCAWRKVKWLAAIECRPKGEKALTEVSKAKADKALAALVEEIAELLAAGPSQPAPDFDDDTHRALAEQLAAAQKRLRDLTIAEADTTLAQEEILDLKRRLREGGQLKAGDVLDGRFQLLEPIGQGGFATVWKGWDAEELRLVAVKVLHTQHGHSLSRRERFFRGAKRMARLRHEGIVGVVQEKGEDAGFHFFVMEYVPGGDLRQAVLAGRIPPASALGLIRRLGEALGHAHGQRVIHRDVKPANVLLDSKGNPKLTDFDLVRVLDSTAGTRTGMMGTFVYAAPESLTRVQDSGPAADVYSLAMTAVFVLHGKELPPTVFRDPGKFIEGLACSRAVRDALEKATAWEVADRYSTVGEFLAAIEPEVVRVQILEEPPPATWASDTGEDEYGRWASFEVGSVVHRLRWIPPGRFHMGSPEDEAGRLVREGPRHEVTLTEGFWLGETPCTQALWEAVMGKNPSHFRSPSRPVEEVNGDDCAKFLKRLNERVPGLSASLPTEAQWEYACRAGVDAAKYAPLDAAAWYVGNSLGRTHPVGQKLPNPWGLYDMLGNVYEWCTDYWADTYPGRPRTDPTGPAEGAERVFRGGSWNSLARNMRAAFRNRHLPGNRLDFVGLRLARGQGGPR